MSTEIDKMLEESFREGYDEGFQEASLAVDIGWLDSEKITS